MGLAYHVEARLQHRLIFPLDEGVEYRSSFETGAKIEAIAICDGFCVGRGEAAGLVGAALRELGEDAFGPVEELHFLFAVGRAGAYAPLGVEMVCAISFAVDFVDDGTTIAGSVFEELRGEM